MYCTAIIAFAIILFINPIITFQGFKVIKGNIRNGPVYHKQLPSAVSHLSKRSVELNHVDLFVQGGDPQGASHSQHAATLIPLDTGHVHERVYEHGL